MAVTDVNLIWSGEGANLSKELDFESPGQVDYAEVYEVIAAGSDTAITVLTAANVPKVGDQLGSNYLWVTNVSPQRDSPIRWLVTVTYNSLDFDPQNPTANPLTAPAKVKWKTVKTTGEIDEDVDGNAIVTPAGEPVRGITRPFSDVAAVITQAIASFNSFAFYDFIDHVNSDSFLGWPPGTAKVENIDADPQELTVNNVSVRYYNLTVEIVFRNPIRTTPAKAWYNRRVLKGNFVLDAGGNKRPALVDGELAPGPVFLAANGQETTAANAVWVEDKIFASVAFSGMQLRV